MVRNLSRRRGESCIALIVRSRVTSGSISTYKKTHGATNIIVNSTVDSECELLAFVSKLFDKVWVLDRGSSYHVTYNIRWFATYKLGDFGAIYEVSGAPERIMGMRDIMIKTQYGDNALGCQICVEGSQDSNLTTRTPW
jgi:hypothetical protein